MLEAGGRAVADLLHAAGRELRRLPGSLVVVPLAVVAVGSQYTCATQQTITSATVTRAASTDGARSAAAEPVRLRFEPEGADDRDAVRLRPDEYLQARLPAEMTAFTLDVQANCCYGYEVEGLTAQGRAVRLWSIPAAGNRPRLRTRTREIAAPVPVASVRIAPLGEEGAHAVSAIRVTTNRTLPHAALPGFAWALFLLSIASLRFAPRPGGRFLLDAWARADATIAVVIIPTLLFRLTPTVLAVAATIALVALVVLGCRHAFRRLTYPALIYNGVLIVLAIWLTPRMVAALVEQSLFYEYDRTIDHRMRPDGDEINADSIRFRGASDSIDARDFNIVFLGDSFTYGFDLQYEEAVPYVVERQLGLRACERPVRAINFGWTTSSPLLSFRLLRDIGHRYHPDLVVYMLDMTDFHDDLRYERQFASMRRIQILPSAVASALLERAALVLFDRSGIGQIAESLRTASERELADVPAQQFFVTNQPLADSVEDIERGVAKNLRSINDYAADALGADMVLVVLPRAFQYTDRESPDNREAGRYDPLGPHVLAPFRYFEQRRDDLPYRVLSLLPAFREARDFPLYFRDDPHWNAAGARVAARGIADYLVREGAVPCGS